MKPRPIPVVSLATILLIVLRAVGFIQWSWWTVCLLPMGVGLALILALLVAYMAVSFGIARIEEWRGR